MGANPIIETVDLTKIYGMGAIQVAALAGVSIRIDPGEFVAIMGPSGSGKSTLMNVLGCLMKPTSGRYILDSEEVSELDKVALARIRNRKIGYIFQSFNLLARTSALDNVVLPLLYDTHNRRTREERQARALKVLEDVGLADRVKHLPQELSGGQQQRVAIARALVNEPVLILADEPTGNLDSRSGLEIMQLLHQLHERGSTIVMVTHDPKIAAETERTIQTLDGRIAMDHQNGASQLASEKTPREAQHEST